MFKSILFDYLCICTEGKTLLDVKLDTSFVKVVELGDRHDDIFTMICVLHTCVCTVVQLYTIKYKNTLFIFH